MRAEAEERAHADAEKRLETYEARLDRELTLRAKSSAEEARLEARRRRDELAAQLREETEAAAREAAAKARREALGEG